MPISSYYTGGPGGDVDPFGGFTSEDPGDGIISDFPIDGTGPSEPPAPPPPDNREDRGENALRNANEIVFPPNLRRERSFFRMEVHKETKGSLAKPTLAELICTIGLPVPGNISEQFQMNYNSIEIGAILGNEKVRSAAGSAVDSLKEIASGQKNSTSGSETSQKFKEATETIKGDLVPYMARTVAKTVDAGLGAIADQMIGGVPNPNLALLYQGHGFRSFQFNWKLVPREPNDSLVIARLINTIKFSMHPGREGLFLMFPYKIVPSIVVNGRSDLFPMKPSVITAFSVNYAPAGTPAFYKNRDMIAPVEIDISISLQESEIFLRGDFEAGLGFR